MRAILDQTAALKRDLEQVIATAENEVQNNRAVSVSLQKVSNDVTALGVASRAIVTGANAILEAVVETASGARQSVRHKHR